MSLGDKIKKEVLDPYMATMVNAVSGTIVEYDKYTNRAVVRVRNPQTNGYLTLRDLTLPIHAPGVATSGPFKGDSCLIQFGGSGLKNPYIVSITEKNYKTSERENKTKHEYQGTYVSDDIIEEEDTDIDLTPEDALDYYEQEFVTNRENLNVVSKLKDTTKDMPYFDLAEPGIVHPKTKSTVKLKNDGSIDLFTALNNGLRISPITNSILAVSSNIKAIAYKLLKLESEGDVRILSKDKTWILANKMYTKTTDNTFLESASEFVIKSQDLKFENKQTNIITTNFNVSSHENYITSSRTYINGEAIFNGEELEDKIYRIVDKQIRKHTNSQPHDECNC